MSKYNFDELIDRHGSNCYKFDCPEAQGKISMWIADMDFKTPDFIMDAMRKRLEHPVMGYTFVPKSYYELLASWVEELHGWKVDPADIRYIPGIVKGIGMVLCSTFAPGTKVCIMPPVYHPFQHVPENNGFEVVHAPLIPVQDEAGHLETYRMDFELIKQRIDEGAKAVILCNPHNPCGICWPESELKELASICASRGVLVISDEIHAEMALAGKKHIPFASVSEEAAECSISFLAPSKTFNIAGIVSSYCIASNKQLREKFYKYIDANELDFPAILPVVATTAAYTEGREWRKEMLEYVQANVEFACDYVAKNIPGVHCVRPDASFLIWLDCRGLGLDHDALNSLFYDKAHLYLNDGEMFGPGGAGFMRLNIGCPRSVLAQALANLEKAVKEL